MSFRAVSWAFDRIRGLSQGEKLVLLALAEFANDEDETWRSREEIAARAECSLRSVATHLKSLDELGLISRRPRYTWCQDRDGLCAGKPAHKHRSGTTYVLHLEVVGDVKSTHANLAHVDFSAECSGCGHTCKSCTCEDGEGSTHAKSRSPHMQLPAPICTYNPQLNPQPDQTRPVRRRVRAEESRDAVAPRVGSVGSGSVSSDDYSASTGNPSEAGQGDSGNFATGRNVDVPGVRLDDEDLRLLAACLPQQLQGLDLQGAVRVVALLRERIEAGWSTEAIRLAMDQPLPDKVRRLSSLVAHRLDVNVAPELAPSRVRAAASETRLWADVVSDRQRISEEIAAEVVSEVDPVWAQAWEDVATAYPNVSRVEQMKLTLARVEALGRSVAG